MFVGIVARFLKRWFSNLAKPKKRKDRRDPYAVQNAAAQILNRIDLQIPFTGLAHIPQQRSNTINLIY